MDLGGFNGKSWGDYDEIYCIVFVKCFLSKKFVVYVNKVEFILLKIGKGWVVKIMNIRY